MCFFEAWKDWTTAEFDYQVLKDSVLGLKTDKAGFFSCKSLEIFFLVFFPKILRVQKKTASVDNEDTGHLTAFYKPDLKKAPP